MTPLQVFSATVAEMFQASSTLCGQDQVKQKKPRSSEPGLLSFRVWSVAAIDSTVGSPHQGVALHKVISILMRPIRAIIAYRCGPEMM